MENIRIINDIKPFNEIFYKTCFYSSLFPIINKYSRDILPIFLNDVIVYDNLSLNNKAHFAMNYIEINSLEDALRSIGIDMKSLYYKEDLINDIKKSIEEDRPVIIWVDCFYEPFRKDSFEKKHWSHTLLIHGFNDNERTIDIVEHKHRDNLSYENRTITYEDIKNSYEGYYNNFKSRSNSPAYFEFLLNKSYEMPNLDFESYKRTFVKNQKEKEKEVLSGLEKLRNFAKDFENIVLDEEALKGKVEDLTNSFNMIINAKQVEVYKIAKLLGEDHMLFKLQQEIVQNWMSIRAIVAKYKFSKIYKQNSFIPLFDKFNFILEDEQLYIEGIKGLMF